MLFKHKSISQSIPLRQQKSSTKIFSGFFLQDENFVSRTIIEGIVDLEKFPASTVRQLEKKLEFQSHCMSF